MKVTQDGAPLISSVIKSLGLLWNREQKLWRHHILGELTKELSWTQFKSSLDVSTYFDLGYFLSATDPVPCYFLYNFDTYGLLGKADSGHY
jgi:hypothetical protein